MATQIVGAEIVFGLSLMPASGEWGAWNNTHRPAHEPECVAPTSEGLVEQIKAAYPDRVYKEHGDFFIIDPVE